MVTDYQVRILMKSINQSKTLKTAAAKAGMSEKKLPEGTPQFCILSCGFTLSTLTFYFH
jgi:hypothetical protein